MGSVQPVGCIYFFGICHSHVPDSDTEEEEGDVSPSPLLMGMFRSFQISLSRVLR